MSLCCCISPPEETTQGLSSHYVEVGRRDEPPRVTRAGVQPVREPGGDDIFAGGPWRRIPRNPLLPDFENMRRAHQELTLLTIMCGASDVLLPSLIPEDETRGLERAELATMLSDALGALAGETMATYRSCDVLAPMGEYEIYESMASTARALRKVGPAVACMGRIITYADRNGMRLDRERLVQARRARVQVTKLHAALVRAAARAESSGDEEIRCKQGSLARLLEARKRFVKTPYTPPMP